MENAKHNKRRIIATLVVVCLIAVGLIVKIAHLHFSQKVSIANKNSNVKRGDIIDAEGNPLAVTIYRYSVFADPRKVLNPDEYARKLSPIVDEPAEHIKELLARDRHFVWIERKVHDDVSQRIRELALPGIHLKKEYARVYPEGTLAAQVIGFVNIDNVGLEGIEFRYNDILLKADSSNEKEEKGLTVQLTIDRTIQYIAQKAINDYTKSIQPKKAAILIMEIKTGKILALALYPQIHPEYFFNYDLSDLTCYSVVNAFEPGSTMKVFAAVALLDHVPDALARSYICKGSIEVYDAVIKCSKEHGVVNLNDIFTFSCNSGIIQAIHHIRKEQLYNALTRFGFGERTGVQMSGESQGILRETRHWSGLSKYSLAIGQELSVNSLQLASAIGAIANKGVYMYPQIVKTVLKNNGEVVKGFTPRSKGKILNEPVAKTILSMMRNTVIKGTGARAAVADIIVGGKTGTAQKSLPQGGYIPDAYVVSFVGIAPLDNPDVCVLVLLDEPKYGGTGGELAAPVFREVITSILPLRGIGKTVITDASAKQKAYQPKHKNTMPNFIGESDTQALRQIISIQKNYPIQYTLKGSGKVTAQNPKPGLPLEEVRTITLILE